MLDFDFNLCQPTSSSNQVCLTLILQATNGTITLALCGAFCTCSHLQRHFKECCVAIAVVVFACSHVMSVLWTDASVHRGRELISYTCDMMLPVSGPTSAFTETDIDNWSRQQHAEKHNIWTNGRLNNRALAKRATAVQKVAS